ncbi:MAG: hypothetical protein EOO01_10815 [Chitinophagaceae bacterium]|nr:MAG: hypothetical protein EOO01_10815 [Chitinophagaceae bacterium]
MFQQMRQVTKRFLIFLNCLVALGFLIGAYAYLFDPVALWFIGFFALGAFYLLLALLLFFLFWLFAKPVFALISTIAVLAAWNPLQNLVQLRMSPNFVMKKHPAHLRVMSWNVEHFEIIEFKKNPSKKQAMINMIRAYNPDVACFQEMVGAEQDSAAINYVPAIMKELGFMEYHYAFNPKLDFDREHHFGIIIFSKYPLIKKHNVSYSPFDYNSIFQYADVVKDSDTIRLINLHLQSLRFNKENLEYINKPAVNDREVLNKSRNLVAKFKRGFLRRADQANRIATSIAESPYPVVVCGDFNDVPNSYSYHTIGRNMKNAYTEKGTGIGRTFSGISPTLRIDNIFCSEQFTVEQFVRIKKNLSDHYALVADLFLRKP